MTAGRKRDAALDQRLLATTWHVLCVDGYDALTFSIVAARARAHRTDVYRRWSSKAQLVTDAVLAHLPRIPEVDTGSLAGDLRAYAAALAGLWAGPWTGGLTGLVSDLRDDAEARAAFAKIAGRNERPLLDAIARAARRGEIDSVPALALIGHLVEGPLMHQRLFGGPALTDHDLDAIAAAAHRELTVPASALLPRSAG
ncbi:MAG TPA: TetR-like C-terminal domain-containing protein [Microbacterium sp.]|nr:TetR-like C-terminal domain-containing protein [Microbacterium sp.]